jgi:uncharacterized repeat protein (TIGR03803 family)
MTISGFGRRTLTSCVTVAILAGCGGSLPPTSASSAPGNARDFGQSFTARHGYRRLSAFHVKDGAGPQGLTAVDGLLYGTTSRGGRNDAGTFFSFVNAG